MGAVADGDLVAVREGRASLWVPRDHPTKGPGRVGRLPFYNRAMALPRHLAVLLLQGVEGDVRKVLDALAATGVLGIRLHLEGGRPLDLHANDLRSAAVDLIRRNLKANGVEAAVSQEDANVLLVRERFDYVDVDPFGSPVPFLDNALRALRPRGFLGLTATDTAPLAGTYPRVCRRRYGATPWKGPAGHEVGLRILAGNVVRIAARYDLAARPILSLWREHYYKQFFAVRRGARRADAALASVARIRWERPGPPVVDSGGPIGPLWTGPVHDPAVLDRMEVPDYMPGAVARLLDLFREEAETPPLFSTTDELASRAGISPPPLRPLIERLKEGGHSACRTSFHPKGLKTDAPWDEVVRLAKGFGDPSGPNGRP